MTTSTGSWKDNPDDQLQRLGVLWEEYKYRHDLCWRVIFRLTAAIVVLAIVPYVYTDVVQSLQQEVQSWLVLVPLLAVGLVIFGIFLIANELAALQRVKDEYRQLQKERLFTEEHREDKIGFGWFVFIYFGILFLLSTINLYVVLQQLQQQ